MISIRSGRGTFHRFRSKCAAALLSLALLLVGTTAATAADAVADADTLVALIVNFARYTEWPEGHSPEEIGKWNICAESSDEAFSAALRAIDERPLYQQPIQIQFLEAEKNSTSDCHLLFISHKRKDSQLRRVLLPVDESPTLTVSDHPNFTQLGGMIGLVIEEGRYEFDVDYSRVLQSELRLDSGMLKLARRVR